MTANARNAERRYDRRTHEVLGGSFLNFNIGGFTMIIRNGQKTELVHLAQRHNLRYIDATESAEENTLVMYGRDREGWVYAWMVEFDGNDEIKLAEELLVFDSENAPTAIPSCIAEETRRLENWHAIMALDPQHDEAYYSVSP